MKLYTPRAVAALTAALALLGTGAASLAQDSGAVDRARSALERWVETERVLSQERRDWALGREVLAGRIAMIEREIEGVRARQTAAEASIAEAERKRAELDAERERLSLAAGELAGKASALEGRLRELLARLPDPIRERVKPLSQSLPADSAATAQTLAERFRNVIGILNEVDKFQREITLASEVRTLPDGRAAEVRTLYVGLGQAYYTNADGSVAGRGVPGAEGWTWSEAGAAGPEIARAIAILQSEAVADFVQLPIRIE